VDGIVEPASGGLDNKEGCVSWHGKQFSVSAASYYRSYSDLGSSLSTDPVTRDFIRTPGRFLVAGALSSAAKYKYNSRLQVHGIYSHATVTPDRDTGPLIASRAMGNFSPDQLNLSSTWKFMPKGQRDARCESPLLP